MPRSTNETAVFAAPVGAPGRRSPSLPKAARYEQLLEAARAIVGRGGVGALTISALTLEAGVSRPVVYEHFANAEAIAIAVLEDYFTQIVAFVDARTRDSASLDEYIALVVDAHFEMHGDSTMILRELVNGHSTSDRLNATFQALRNGSVETFTELLRQQGVAADVAHCGGHAISAMFMGAIVEFAGGDDTQTAKDTLRAMLWGAIHALVPQAQSRPSTPEKILLAAQKLTMARGRQSGP